MCLYYFSATEVLPLCTVSWEVGVSSNISSPQEGALEIVHHPSSS